VRGKMKIAVCGKGGKETMSKKYSIIYKKPDEMYTFVIPTKAKTAQEARTKFEKQHPDWTIVAINET
jgi:hypothetical protein